MIGPGKYTDEAVEILKQTNAEMVLLIVCGGDRGNGSSVAATDPAPLEQLPDILREVIEGIEEDIKQENK